MEVRVKKIQIFYCLLDVWRGFDYFKDQIHAKRRLEGHDMNGNEILTLGLKLEKPWKITGQRLGCITRLSQMVKFIVNGAI